MPKKQVIQSTSSAPEYDEQTKAFIQSAKSVMASNHGIMLDRDPAEVMRENNSAIHEAAKTLAAKQGMKKQTLSTQPRSTSVMSQVIKQQPVQRPVQPMVVQKQQPVDQSFGLTDKKMREVGYDALMSSMMSANRMEPEPEETEEPEEMQELAEVVVEAPVQQIPQPVPVQPKKIKELPRQNAEPPRQSPVFVRQEVTNFTDVRGLPSEGLLYEEPIMGQSLTLMDILMINHMDAVNVTSSVNTLLERRLTGGWSGGFVAENVLECDQAYLMHWLRASTTDDNLPYVPPNPEKWTPYTCPDCHAVANNPEDYSKLIIKFENLDFKINGDLQSIVAKHANGCYSFRLLDQRQCDVYLRRRYHETEINNTLEKYRKDTGTDMPFEMQVILHSAVIVEIEGIDNIVDKINYLGAMGYKEAKHFFDEVNGASLTTDITAKVICPFCKKEVTIPYPFRLEYYISSL